ncbi:MAG: TetR/AcrR family transcriptional regulator [Emcibacter sp.]|nr:TetR/AcrR family transcriptional regulator [Emcibacter sp.]
MLAEKTDDTVAARGEGTQVGKDNQQRHILVQTALRLFHERGYSKVTLADIAKAAGLSLKETEDYFPSLQKICHQVIEAHSDRQMAEFEIIEQNSNPRQRLSLYLDTLVEDTDVLISKGCPMTNLYFDVKREDSELADHAAELLQQRLGWIREQFVVITRVENITDLPERLDSAIHGISILAQVTGAPRLIQNQVNQLKSWIRSM